MILGTQAINAFNFDPSVAQRFILNLSGVSTIATTGNTDIVCLIPTLDAGVKWKLEKAEFFTGAQGLAANDTNYITFSITNKSNSDAAMLAATDPNTTKATGGTAVTAYTVRGLTVSTTAASLVVDTQDVLLIRFAVTGTLGATMPNSGITLTFAQKTY